MNQTTRSYVLLAIKAIAFINIIAAVVAAIFVCEEPLTVMAVLIGGIISAVFWFALAVIVDAADWYISCKEAEYANQTSENRN